MCLMENLNGDQQANKNLHFHICSLPPTWCKKKPRTNPFSVSFVFRMLSRLTELIWSDWIWFPEGHGWADLEDRDGKVFPKPRDLWATIPIALCFLVIRQIFERWVMSSGDSCHLPVNLRLYLSDLNVFFLSWLFTACVFFLFSGQ